jgi:hypothetical protein
MRKLMFLAVLGLLIGGASVRACDTNCPTGQHWVWTDSQETKGNCIADPTNGTSSSTANSSANSNQSQSQQQTANGGAGGSVKDSGNSSSTATGGSVKNSGNSSNKNTNTAQGGQGGSASATGGQGGAGGTANATAGNSSSGSGNTTDISTNVEAPKIPVATAYAPMIAPTVTCFKGASGAVQTMAAGVSFGVGRIDENCAILEAARSGAAYTGRLTFCKVYITNKYVKKAGVTLADCLQRDEKPVPVAAVVPDPIPPAQPTIIVVPTPAPVAALAPPAAPIARNLTVERPIGICHFTNECKRLLDDAVLILKSNDHASVKIVGPSSDAALLAYLHDNHIPASRVLLQIEDSDSTSVAALIAE